jgi:hypothetical protein
MARTDEISFVEKHLEKFILGIAVIVLLVAVGVYAFHSPREVELRSAPGIPVAKTAYPPTEVDPALAAMADQMERQLNNAKTTEEPLPNIPDMREALLGQYAGVDVDRPGAPMSGGRAPLKYDGGTGGVVVKLADLTPLPEPGAPLVNIRHEVQAVPDPVTKKIKAEEVVAAHGAAVFPYGPLYKKWNEVLAKTYVPARVTFVVVDVQRRIRAADGAWSPAQDMPSFWLGALKPPPLPPELTGTNLKEVFDAVRLLEAFTPSVVQPPYYDLLGAGQMPASWLVDKPLTMVSEKWAEPLPAIDTGAAPAPTAPTTPGPAVVPATPGPTAPRVTPGGPAPVRPGATTRRTVPVTPVTAVPVTPVFTAPVAPAVHVPPWPTQLADDSGLLEVWFHDPKVSEGVTYQYRLRLRLLNPLLGQIKVAASPEDAKVVLLDTPWSGWSEPALATRPTEFYLVGASSMTNQVVIDVVTTKLAQQVRHRFTVGKGDPIGDEETKDLVNPGGGGKISTPVDFRTGAVVVDFVFDIKQRMPGTGMTKTTNKMIYLDADGNLCTRYDLEDKASPKYQTLDKALPK